MTGLGEAIILVGALIAALAGIGLLRFRSTFTRLHAAGKASPISFALIAIGGALITGGWNAARLVLAAVALMLALPVATHMLMRAAHRSRDDGSVWD